MQEQLERATQPGVIGFMRLVYVTVFARSALFGHPPVLKGITRYATQWSDLGLIEKSSFTHGHDDVPYENKVCWLFDFFRE